MATTFADIAFGPVEVLDVIFSFCSVNDLKTCRLVNQYWRNAAKDQLNKRVALRLREETDLENKSSITLKVKSLREDDFQNFILVKCIPKSFEISFKMCLKSLKLVDVTFNVLNDARMVAFEAFPSIVELAFVDVLLTNKTSVVDRTPPSPHADNHLVPKVRRLLIQRSGSKNAKRCQDLFEVWDINELIQRLSSSLKEISVWRGQYGKTTSVGLDFFQILQRNNISLTSLSYGVVETLEEVESFNAYIATHGSSLKKLHVDDSFTNLFNRLSQGNEILVSNIEHLNICHQNWSLWVGDNLEKLKYVFVDQYHSKSIDSFQRMPNLETVDFKQTHNFVGVFGNFGLNSYVNQYVHTLRLSEYHARDLPVFSKQFPNVSKLVIENPCDCCTRNGSDPVLRPVCKAWPNLLDLELKGSWFKYFRTLLPRMRRSKRKPGIGIGNTINDQYDCLKTLSRLRSFVNKDEEALKIWYGDKVAKDVFLKLPNLRTLEIARCSMSQDVIEQLRKALMVFCFHKRS